MIDKDELAERLHRAGEAAGGPSPSTRKRSKFWKAVATECLRQMEWAYECRKQDEHLGTDIETALTLAPEDWKP